MKGNLSGVAIAFFVLAIVFVLTGSTGVGISFLAVGIVFMGTASRQDDG